MSGRVLVGGGIVLAIVLACVGSLPWTASPRSGWYFDAQQSAAARLAPSTTHAIELFGHDALGRPLLSRCLFGGCISLAVGFGAAAMAVSFGVSIGLLSGYRGGWVDGLLMRSVDILYGLPYILVVVLLKFAVQPGFDRLFGSGPSNVVTMFVAIGSVGWLTMARVVRGQVLSLRGQPFIEAARACGVGSGRIFAFHLLPNLAGPIIVYATLVVPSAILQESLLSFLGVGVQPPIPTWGSLAAEGMGPALNPIHGLWWLLLFPCMLLAVTLLGLNFAGDGLRDVLDPRREGAKL